MEAPRLPALPAAPVPAFHWLPEHLLALVFNYADDPETGAAGASCRALRAAALHSMPALVLRDGGAATTVLARLQQQRPTTAAAAATAPYRRLRSLVLAGDMTTTATTTTTDDRDPGPGPGPYPLTSDLLTRLAGPPLARLDLEGLKVPTPEALAALLDLLQLLGPGVDAAVAQQEAVGDDGDGRLVAFGLPGPGAAGAVPMDPQSLGKVLRATMTTHLQELGCGRLGAQAAGLATAYLLGSSVVDDAERRQLAGFVFDGHPQPPHRRALIFLLRLRCLQGDRPLQPDDLRATRDPLSALPPDPWRLCALRRLDLCGATVLHEDMAALVGALTLGTAPHLTALILCTKRAYRRWRRFRSGTPPHGQRSPDHDQDELDQLRTGRLTPGAVRVLLRCLARQHDFGPGDGDGDGAWFWRLEELDLSGQRAFGDRGLRALSRAIYTGYQKAADAELGRDTLQYRLSSNSWRRRRASEMPGACCRLRVLRLADTGITAASAWEPTEPPYPPEARDTLVALVNPRFLPLEELDLRGNPLGEATALRLLDGRRQHACLGWGQAIYAASHAWSQRHKIWPPTSRATRLRRLWVDTVAEPRSPLWRNTRCLEVRLALPDCLVTLCLRGQRLGDVGAYALAALLGEGRMPRAEEVDLADNGIGDCGAFALLCALRLRHRRPVTTTPLRRLCLARNDIHGWGCSLLPAWPPGPLTSELARALDAVIPRLPSTCPDHHSDTRFRVVQQLLQSVPRDPTAPTVVTNAGMATLDLHGNPLTAIAPAVSLERFHGPTAPWCLAVGPALRVLDLRGAHGAKRLPFPATPYDDAAPSSQEQTHERARRRVRAQLACREGWMGVGDRPSVFDGDGDLGAMAHFSRPAYYAYRGQPPYLEGRPLGEALREAPGLEVLRLSESRLDDAGFCALLDALAITNPTSSPTPTTTSTTPSASPDKKKPRRPDPTPTAEPSPSPSPSPPKPLLPNLWWLDLCDSDVGDRTLRRLLPPSPHNPCPCPCPCPRLRRLGLAGTRGAHATTTVPALAAALKAGAWPGLQELSLSLLAPRGLGALPGKGAGKDGRWGENENPVAAALLEQRDAARACLTAARQHFDVLRLERGWGREEDVPPATAAAATAGGGGGAVASTAAAVLGRALSSLWPSAASALAATATADADAAAAPASGDGHGGDDIGPGGGAPGRDEPAAGPQLAERLGGLGLGLLGSERGEDEWEYWDAVEERLDALERRVAPAVLYRSIGLQEEEEEEGGLLAFDEGDFDEFDPGPGFWETWLAYDEWDDEEEAGMGTWDDHERDVRADSESSEEESVDGGVEDGY